MSTNYNSKKIANIYINSNFSTDGVIKINANYNYSYGASNNFSHISKFFNNNQKFKEIKLNHKSNVVSNKFNIPAVNSTRISLLIYLANNNNDNSSAELFDYNTIQIIYNDDVETSKTDTNTSNISSNLTKIGTNKTNISSNLNKIGTNENAISSNLNKIGTIKNAISSNLTKIGTNENAISSNLTKIGTKENAISSNLEKIGTNESAISSSLTKIGINENAISSNSERINSISDVKIESSDNYYISKNLHILELDFSKNIKLEQNNEFLVYEK